MRVSDSDIIDAVASTDGTFVSIHNMICSSVESVPSKSRLQHNLNSLVKFRFLAREQMMTDSPRHRAVWVYRVIK